MDFPQALRCETGLIYEGNALYGPVKVVSCNKVSEALIDLRARIPAATSLRDR
jgi:hypothetical protein